MNVIINHEQEKLCGQHKKTMAELFNVTKQNFLTTLKTFITQVNYKKIQLSKKILTVQNEGKRKVKRNQTFYNLDAIISIVYRVNSKKQHSLEYELQKWQSKLHYTVSELTPP